MAKVSLADLRSGDVKAALPERTYDLCIRPDLMAEIESLLGQVGPEPTEDEKEGQPQRLNPKSADGDRVARLKELSAQVADATGELRLRAIPDGEWRRWVNDHPPREKNPRDENLAFGLCNTDDLASDLARWVRSWNGELLGPDDWATLLLPNAAGGDLKALANLVVMMQESTADPKWLLRVSLGGQMSSDEGTSPEQ